MSENLLRTAFPFSGVGEILSQHSMTQCLEAEGCTWVVRMGPSQVMVMGVAQLVSWMRRKDLTVYGACHLWLPALLVVELPKRMSLSAGVATCLRG